MSNIMAVLLNGIAQLEYDRDKPLPVHQEMYLDKMDEKMDAGILMGEELVRNPESKLRAQFVAANLAHAINNNDESTAAALTSYLAVRQPELKQVSIEDNQGEVTIELIYDEEYRKQVAVQFTHLH